MYGLPGGPSREARLSRRMVAGPGPQVNAAGWVNLGVWGLKREAFGA